MTTLTIAKFFFHISLILLGALVIYKEKELIKFERKAKKYIKAFFKAVYYTILEKRNEKNVPVEELYKDEYKEEYDKMLADLNKASKIDDIMVA